MRSGGCYFFYLVHDELKVKCLTAPPDVYDWLPPPVFTCRHCSFPGLILVAALLSIFIAHNYSLLFSFFLALGKYGRPSLQELNISENLLVKGCLLERTASTSSC